MKFKVKKVLLSAILILSVGILHAQQPGKTSTIATKGYAAMDSIGKLIPFDFDRRTPGDSDIVIEIMYSGVCHSDVHQAHAHWGDSHYPMVPGHEIVGRVIETGKNVKHFKVGDYAGVGPMINSCGVCEYCQRGEEQHCVKSPVYAYNRIDYTADNTLAQGGYADKIVVTEDFVFKIPEDAPLAQIGPLFCAGVTTYSPLKKADIKRGDKVGVAGFGGLGHLALQYALSMEAEVIVFDITEEKRETALQMGATKYVNINNPGDLEGLNNSFKIILSTIPANFDVAMYIKMLRVNGSLVLIGQPALEDVPSVSTQTFVENPGRNMYFSLIGGTKETREMLDYSIRHKIFPKVEIIPMTEINRAFEDLVNGKPRFRYVIDMSTLK